MTKTLFCLALLRIVPLVLAVTVLPTALGPVVAYAQTEQRIHQFDLPSQPLADALRAVGSKAGVNIVFEPSSVRDRQAPALRGSYTVEEAVGRLVEGSGLSVRKTDGGSLLISVLPRSGAEAIPEAIGAAAPTKGEQIVVTGTHIRGVQPSSHLVTVTQEDMRLSGHSDLGQVIRALPQNFNGGQNPEVGSGATAGGGTNANRTGSSSLNLRGLGPDATLVLLNGTRMPYDGILQATDVSVIPVAAIDRVEVLLDGASAIYGSDAVGGVANIILRRDYKGAEISVREGAATDGGYRQQRYTGLAGTTWDKGGFLLAGEVSRDTAIKARDRNYLAYLPNQDAHIYPPAEQSSVLFTGHQELSGLAKLSFDAFYTDRQQRFVGQTSFPYTEERHSEIWGISPSVRFSLPREWSLELHGFAGNNDSENHLVAPTIAFESRECYCNKVNAVGVEAGGALVDLPGGKARLSVGGGYRKNEFQQANLLTGVTTIGGADRSNYVYGEVNLPLVSEAQRVPLITRLSVNGAVRHENYKSFGETTTPKIGAIWGISSGFDVKATWGKSFKVPALLQQFQAPIVFLRAGATRPGVPAGSTTMEIGGGRPDLGPERAEVVTAGFTFRPARLDGFQLEFGWFNIDYKDRVVQPIAPLAQGVANPLFAPFVTLNPTVAQQNAIFAAVGAPIGTFTANSSGGAYNPANVYAILDNRWTNAAAQHLSGIDFSAIYTADILGGVLTTSTSASWIRDSTRKLTATAPEIQTTGLIYFPPRLRGRIGASWSRAGLTLASNINYSGGVKNTNITPNPEGGSMTTMDFAIDYQTVTRVVGDIRLNLAVTNLFDKRPPFLQPLFPYYLNYDSTNYSAVGRVVSLTVTKRF
jgi:iron complex outermembrane recepter protein